MKFVFSFLVAVSMLTNIAYANVIDSDLTLYKTVIGNSGMKIADITEDDVITRNEMVDIIINMIQIQKDEIYAIKYYSKFLQRPVTYTPFSDWLLEENKEKLVERLYECGIIKGCTNNIFRPNDACTIEEAITFIVRAIGWTPLAEAKGYGGFPKGYIKVAEEIGLLDKDFSITDVNMNQIVSTIIFNGLFAETIELDVAKLYNDYYYVSAPSALERFHGLSYTYGYATKCKDGVMINDEVFIGGVSNNEIFNEGYVFCIYDENNAETEKNMVLCLEISKTLFEDISN